MGKMNIENYIVIVNEIGRGEINFVESNPFKEPESRDF